MRQKRRIPFGLVLLFLGFCSPAYGATVDPLLRGMQREQGTMGFPYERVIAVTDRDAKSGPTVGVVLDLEQEFPDFSKVSGLVIGSVIGTVATARLPLSSLDTLAGLPGVSHVQAARIQWPTMDQAVAAGKVVQVWSGSPAYTGDGVLVGIIDSGIDWQHEDFRNPDGSSRIKAIWDQYATGTAPAGFAYGAEYSAEDIEQGTVDEADYSGHGTHVAGIAAGDGSASIGQYRGVAFESEILFAKAFDDNQGGFPEDKTIDAMNYLVQKASALGKPIAINMSLGGHYGPHDGTSAEEKVLNELSGPGVVFCVAAGNEGQDSQHATVSADGGNLTYRVQDYAPNTGSGNDYAMVTLWLDGSSTPSVTVSGDGQSLGPIAPGAQNGFATGSGVVVIDNASGGVDPDNGDRQIMIQWNDSQGIAPAAADWTISLTGGAGTAHAWRVTSSMVTDFPNSDYAYSVGMPATAAQAVTVGAFKTRNDWQSQAGHVGYVPGSVWGDTEIGGLAPFSSIGPTRDERQKPDLVAPGMAIVSCYSRDTSPVPGDEWLIPGGDYFVSQGTSMASPFACGVVALMLEKKGDLTALEVRDLLWDSALQDTQTGPVWNRGYGAGKIDAQAAVTAVPGAGVIPGGDIDGDGQPTVLDVIALVNYILDPVANPLTVSGRIEADVFPAPSGDGLLNVSDLTRIVAIILGSETQDKIRSTRAPMIVELGDPSREGGHWWLPLTLKGSVLAAGQLAVDLPGAHWLPSEVATVSGGGFQVAAQAVATQIRLLVYDWHNQLPPEGVSLRLPFDLDSGEPGTPQVAGVLLVDAQGVAQNVTIEKQTTTFSSFLNISPNPVPGAAAVSFRLPENEPYTLSVFDLRGHRLRTLQQGTGAVAGRQVNWDGRDDDGRSLPTGIYLLRLRGETRTLSRKVVMGR